MFDALVDELRTHSTDWLRRERESLLVQQRNLRTREMAVLAVLDERGQVDCSLGADGESAQTVRTKVETARALESLPAIAQVALDGAFSDEQLSSVVKVADEESDREWARRGPATDPVELERMARQAKKPTAEDSRARFAARELRMWKKEGYVHLRGQLPDDMGAAFESTITQLTEKMKVKGEPWRPFEQRAADALLALCERHSSGDEHEPTLAAQPNLQVAVPARVPPTSPGSPSPTACWSSCGPTRPSNRSSSTTTGRCSASAGAAPPSPPSCAERSCCATGTAGCPAALAAAASRSTTCSPRARVAPPRSPTSPRCAPRITDS
jgi:hypothetical protein